MKNEDNLWNIEYHLSSTYSEQIKDTIFENFTELEYYEESRLFEDEAIIYQLNTDLENYTSDSLYDFMSDDGFSEYDLDINIDIDLISLKKELEEKYSNYKNNEELEFGDYKEYMEYKNENQFSSMMSGEDEINKLFE